MGLSKFLVVLILTTVIVLSGSLALVFAHGGNTSLVHACVKSNGAVRIVGPNDVCGSNETPLDWPSNGSGSGPTISSFYQRKASSSCSTPGGCLMIEPLVATCDSGDQATGGSSYYLTSGLTPYQSRASIPYPFDIAQPPSGWAIPIGEAPTGTMEVIAVCADMTP